MKDEEIGDKGIAFRRRIPIRFGEKKRKETNAEAGLEMERNSGGMELQRNLIPDSIVKVRKRSGERLV